MSEIKTKVEARLKQAMLDQDKDLLLVLRNMLTRFMEYEKAEKVPVIGDAAAAKVLAKMSKQLKETAALYAEQGRPDLQAVELYQRSVIVPDFIPEPIEVLDEEQTLAAVQAAIAGGVTNMRELMPALKAQYGDAIDGKVAATLGGALLNPKAAKK